MSTVAPDIRQYRYLVRKICVLIRSFTVVVVVLWHVWEEEKFGSNHIRIVGLLCLTILPLAPTVQQCFPAICPWRNPKHFCHIPRYPKLWKRLQGPPQKKRWQLVAHGDYYSVANYLLTPWSRVLLEKLTSKLCS